MPRQLRIEYPGVGVRPYLLLFLQGFAHSLVPFQQSASDPAPPHVAATNRNNAPRRFAYSAYSAVPFDDRGGIGPAPGAADFRVSNLTEGEENGRPLFPNPTPAAVLPSPPGSGRP